MTIQNRISWEKHALILAFGASLRSEDPYTRVGACALDYNHNVLGVSYNGLISNFTAPKGFWKDRDKRRQYMIHAETNLLARININQAHIIAVTLLPCSSCAINIAAHKIKKVVYSEKYDYDTKGLDIFKFYNIEVKQIPYREIKNEVHKLLV